MHKSDTLIVLLGPTGIGKTSLSIQLAQHYKTHIISCDSRQMYRELKIGTAAPSQDELNAAPHHFIGNISIQDYYNASMFEEESLQLLKALFEQHKQVVLTGGSGMYADAVVKGIDQLPSIDPKLREDLKQEVADKGIEWLQQELQQVDPEYFEVVDQQNAKRMLKGLEIYKTTGIPYSNYRTNTIKERPFNIIQVGLQMDRAELYKRIDKRVDIMIEDGLIEEAKTYYPYKDLNALNTVGYKELFAHFDGEYNQEEAIRLIKRNSRRYAKRQITWWNRDKSIAWFHPSALNEIITYINSNME